MNAERPHAQTLDRLSSIQRATRAHRRTHGCGAYTFEDGHGLIELVQSADARRVLELGTALGFTACCLAQGHESARVDTIEADETHVRLARKHIAEFGLAANITVHHGQFEEGLAGLEPGYDAAFFDGFAPSLALLDQLRTMLRNGGLLICANIGLAHGEERQKLDAYIGRADLWRPRPSIESGQTKVCLKV